MIEHDIPMDEEPENTKRTPATEYGQDIRKEQENRYRLIDNYGSWYRFLRQMHGGD